MRAKSTIRKTLATAALAVATIGLVDGCAGPPRRDWRQAARAGDFAYAYADLFENWRAGTPDIKAESLRYAWRDPGIVAAAGPDLASHIRELAARHGGDLASLAKQVKDGPLEDRAEFAKLVDRRVDVDAEIKAALDKRGPVPAVRAPETAAAPPVATPAPVPTAVAKPDPVEAAAPSAVVPAPPAVTRPAVQSSPPPAPIPVPAPAPEKMASPEDRIAGLLAQVAEARRHAAWRCDGPRSCDAAWAAAESFVGRNSDMRIRAVTPAAIETYPPIVIGEIGMSVEKVGVDASAWEIRPTVHCRAGKLRQACPAAELRIYTAFPAFLRSAVK